MFWVYAKLGFQHITDLQGYDHMLFMLALIASFRPSEWRKILVLITAFTVGHSITLALAVLDLVRVDSTWVEFLIPVTIVITATFNLARPEKHHDSAIWLEYSLALGFGLIHGLGFSNYLRALLMDDLLVPLLSFNIGLEAGQVLVVGLILAVYSIITITTKVKHKWWNIALSSLQAAFRYFWPPKEYPPSYETFCNWTDLDPDQQISSRKWRTALLRSSRNSAKSSQLPTFITRQVVPPVTSTISRRLTM